MQRSEIRGFGVLARIGKLPDSALLTSALGQAAARGLHPGYAIYGIRRKAR